MHITRWNRFNSMQNYFTSQEYLEDRRNSIKNRLKNYMKSEDRWDYRENILQTFVRMRKPEKKAVMDVVVPAHAKMQAA